MSCESSCELRVSQDLPGALMMQLPIMHDKEGLGIAAGMKVAATIIIIINNNKFAVQLMMSK